MLEKLLIVQQWVIWFWKMLSDNSGQIQILIALVALVYARRAYHKILDQIKISRNQDSENYKQKSFELKMEILNMFLQLTNIVNSTLVNHYEFEDAIQTTLEGEISDEDRDGLNGTLKIIQNRIKEAKELKAEIMNTTKQINDLIEFDYKEYKIKFRNVYSILFEATNTLNNTELLKAEYIREE